MRQAPNAIAKEELLMLHIGDLYAAPERNSRASLLPQNIVDLANQIESAGGINTPIEAQPQTAEQMKANGGYPYEVTVGYTRVAAARYLVETKGYKPEDVLIPARIVPVADEKTRLLRQISENHDRNGFTPIDEAHAMRRMLDLGFSRMDVRNAFRVAGGKGKGAALKPCSNSYLNLTLGFLDFPKPIVAMIHNGDIDKSAAYTFYKYEKPEWKSIADKLIDAKLKREEKEAEEDNKLDNKVKALEEVKTAAETAQTELQKAEAAAKEADAIKRQLMKEEEDALKLARSTKDPVKKKELDALHIKATKAFKAAEDDTRKKEKAAEALRKKAAANVAKLKKLQEAPKPKTVSTKDVTEAAAAVGAKPKKGKPVDEDMTPRLTVAQYEMCLKNISKPCGMPKADAILAAIPLAFAGTVTMNEFARLVRVGTGEEKAPVKKAAKVA